MHKRVSLIIVDYNSIEQTYNYIENAVNKFTPDNCVDIIIVDNTDYRSVINNEISKRNLDINNEKRICDHDVLCGLYKGIAIVICFADENLGYGKGNNLGFDISEELFHNEVVIFSNNDLIIKDAFDMELFLAPFGDNKVAVVGPDVVDKSETNHQSPYRYISFWQDTVVNYYHMLSDKVFSFWQSETDYSGDSKVCDWVTGCFMAVRSKDFKAVGGFDPNTFLYGEEKILGAKLSKIEKSMYFNNDLKVIHNHSSVVRDNFSEVHRMLLNVRSLWYYYSAYNKIPKYKVYISKILFYLFIPLYLSKFLFKEIMHLPESKP